MSIEWERRHRGQASLLDPSAPAKATQVAHNYWLVEIDGHLVGSASTKLGVRWLAWSGPRKVRRYNRWLRKQNKWRAS